MNFSRTLLAGLFLAVSAQAADDLEWMDSVLPDEVAAPQAEQAPAPAKKAVPVAVKDLPKVQGAMEPGKSITGGPVAKPTVPQSMKTEAVADNRLTPESLAKRGLINDKMGGFSDKLWAGVDRAYADRVLEQIQAKGVHSYSGMKLLQRMLLTAAEAPAGDGKGNWLAVRVNTLHALGFADAGRALLRGISRPETLPADVARVWVESNLMTGDTKRACQYVKQQVLNTDDPFWRQAVMVCQTLQGDKEGLRLSLDAAAEGVRSSDPNLTQLLRVAQSDKGIVPDIKSRVLPPLQAVVVRFTPLLLNEKTALQLPDALQRQVMNDANLSVILRTQVAENLVADYGLEEDLKALLGLYAQYGFTEMDFVDAKAAAKQQNTAVSGRALLWQAAGKPELDTDRALLLQDLWDRAAADGLATLAVNLAPELRNIQPTPALAWFAPDVITAQLQVGRIQAAEPWWQVLNENQSLSKELLAKRTSLNLVFGVVNGNLKNEDLRAWWDNQNISSKPVQAYVLRVLTLLEAMGQTVPADIWQALHAKLNDVQGENGHTPGGLWLRMVGSSLDAGRTGETLLLLVEPLQYVPLNGLAPLALGNIVTGFKFMNMTAEAKAFALEALLGSPTK